MTKKVKHAPKPAETKPEAIGTDVQAAGVETEVDTLVEGDGDPASLGAEHQGGAAGAADGSDRSWLGDAEIPYAPADNAAEETTAEPGGAHQDDGTPADLGDGSALGKDESDGQDLGGGDLAPGNTGNGEGEGENGTGRGGQHDIHADGASDGQDAGAAAGGADGQDQGGTADQLSAIDAELGTVSISDASIGTADLGDGSAAIAWPDSVRDDAKYVDALPDGVMSIGDQVITYADGVYTCFEWRGEPPAWDFVASIGAPHSVADNDDDVDLEDHDRTFSRALREDANFFAAYSAMDEAVALVLHTAGGEEAETWLLDRQYLTLSGMAYLEAAKLLREIGHARATVNVVASQLKITGYLPVASIDGPQKVLLEIFLFTLAALDGFAKGEADRRAREEEEASRKPPAPVPIDETTMEPVDEPFATY